MLHQLKIESFPYCSKGILKLIQNSSSLEVRIQRFSLSETDPKPKLLGGLVVRWISHSLSNWPQTPSLLEQGWQNFLLLMHSKKSRVTSTETLLFNTHKMNYQYWGRVKKEWCPFFEHIQIFHSQWNELFSRITHNLKIEQWVPS